VSAANCHGFRQTTLNTTLIFQEFWSSFPEDLQIQLIVQKYLRIQYIVMWPCICNVSTVPWQRVHHLPLGVINATMPHTQSRPSKLWMNRWYSGTQSKFQPLFSLFVPKVHTLLAPSRCESKFQLGSGKSKIHCMIGFVFAHAMMMESMNNTWKFLCPSSMIVVSPLKCNKNSKFKW
jgi:hypothetical protein